MQWLQILKENKQHGTSFQEVDFKVQVLFHVFVFKELILAVWKEVRYLSISLAPFLHKCLLH